LNYQTAYARRRAASTMTTTARDWLSARVARWRDEASLRERRYRVLSVGCGDGDIDLAMLDALAARGPIDYVGLEIDARSAETFRCAIRQRAWAQSGAVRAHLVEERAEDHTPDARVDLVVFSHVLYYLDDPGAEVLRYLRDHCVAEGRAVIVHSAARGVPEVVSAVTGLPPLRCAEEIRDDLLQRGAKLDWEIAQTALDATEILAESEVGLEILGFCIERDVASLTPNERRCVLDAFASRCEARDGTTWLPEELAFITLPRGA
jgi:SAM-dependent methyltransferase